MIRTEGSNRSSTDGHDIFIRPRDLTGVERAIPFPIRVTLQELLAVADDADLRAEMLSWTIGHLPTSPQPPDRIQSLHDIATNIRSTAERLFAEASEDLGRSIS